MAQMNPPNAIWVPDEYESSCSIYEKFINGEKVAAKSPSAILICKGTEKGTRRAIVMISVPVDESMPDRKYFEKSIKIIDVKTKKQRVLIDKPAGSASPKFSPDSKFITYTRSTGPEIIFKEA